LEVILFAFFFLNANSAKAEILSLKLSQKEICLWNICTEQLMWL